MNEADLENLSKEHLLYLLKDAKKENKQLLDELYRQNNSAEEISRKNNILGKQYIDVVANMDMDNVYNGLISIITTMSHLFSNIVYELCKTKDNLIQLKNNSHDKEKD